MEEITRRIKELESKLASNAKYTQNAGEEDEESKDEPEITKNHNN